MLVFCFCCYEVLFFSECIAQLIVITNSFTLSTLKSNSPLEYIWFPDTSPKNSNCYYLQWKSKLFKLKNLVFWLKYLVSYRKTKFSILKPKIFKNMGQMVSIISMVFTISQYFGEFWRLGTSRFREPLHLINKIHLKNN